MRSEGTFCLVLHSHLPWLPRHGAWPVGEDWLYQAWADSYLPVVDVLHRLAARGHRDLLTLGVTPVLAAQLDHPYALAGMHTWLADRLLRAHTAAARPDLAGAAVAEHRRSVAALETFERDWRHGASPLLRGLTDGGVVELLGGPATHPFAPLLPGRVRRFLLEGGLRDTARRLGVRPAGIWAPECGYAPGMEHDYAAAGIERFLVDGPAMHGDTAAARPVDGTDVLAFGRDLEVTYRVWSPRAGYPGGPDYRDFHTVDADTGLKPARVTGRGVSRKAPYDAARAAAAVERDAADFVRVVRTRLRDLAARRGEPGLVVAAFDTELFGHWWHEGPAWLERVLTLLGEAGVRVTTLRGAAEAGHVDPPAVLPASSWGSGKDWRVWADGPVADLVADNADVATRLLAAADGHSGGTGARDATLDTVAVQAALALSSDWAFMVTKDSAAGYARRRAAVHRDRVRELTDLLPAGRHADAAARAAQFRAQDDLFGHLDARWLRGGAGGDMGGVPARERILGGEPLMRVLMVSWEYPPVVVGGLGRHVGALATALAAAGHDVVVVSRHPYGTDASTHPTALEEVDGIRVLRVAEDPPHLEFARDLVAWTLGLGHAMVRATAALLRPTAGRDGWVPDVVHAHDWLVAHAAIALADLADAPLVATLHATEAGRHGGWLSAPLNQQVHSVEWWLARSADTVVTCSRAMRAEVAELYDLDPTGIAVVHNGIDPAGWAHPRTVGDGPPTLVYFGRLEWEKGVQDLVAALPAIRRAHPGTRLYVAGTGSHAEWLLERARAARVRRAVTLLGHVDDAALVALLAAASAVVLPSRYEPFGIVALEAAAVGAPLVAARTGGLAEVVVDGVTGLSFDAADVRGLAAAVVATLDDPVAAARRARAGRERLATDFAWPRIAAETVALYGAARRRERAPLERPKIPTGNVFGRT